MKTEDLLILQLVLTLLFSLGALATSVFVIFRIFLRERQRLNETEKHAFELYDAIFQSFIPRTLGDKLSNIYKTEVDAQAMNDKPIIVSAKQVNPNQTNAQQQPGQPGQPPQIPGTQPSPAAPAAAGTGIPGSSAPPPVAAATPGIPQPAPTKPAPAAAPPQPVPPPVPAVAMAQAPALPP